MKLSQLLREVDCQVTGGDPEITGVVCDSRKIIPGCLFVALAGARADGHAFIPAAVAGGAAAVLAEHTAETGPAALAVTGDTRRALAFASAAFYGHPARKLTMIGVTGTKGKTTTTHIIKSILLAAGYKTAMVGTAGYYIGGEKISDALNTTPESLDLHRFFARALAAGCTHLVMEVSSQAAKLERTAGLFFHTAVFLNLSPDHIGEGEHKDFAEYLACKASLFRRCERAVACADSEYTPAILEGCAAPVTYFGFAGTAQVRGFDVRPVRGAGLLGSRFSVTGYKEPFTLAMPGDFNVSDALAAIAVARVLNVGEAAVRKGLETVSVRGRTELYPGTGDYTVLIDYAHNDVSMKSLLTTLRGYDPNRVIVVVGAGGDRSRLRRTDMARELAKYADFAVVTMDNPRSERVEDICADLVAGLEGKIPSVEIYDRAEAIRYALDMARPGDIIALVGKGHEEYIEINGVHSHFSEKEVLDGYFSK